MAAAGGTIIIEHDFQGGLTLAASGVKNGLLAAVELGLIEKASAVEILMLIREATEQLLSIMNE